MKGQQIPKIIHYCWFGGNCVKGLKIAPKMLWTRDGYLLFFEYPYIFEVTGLPAPPHSVSQGRH